MDQPQKHRALGAWLKHGLQLAVGLALFGVLLYLGGLESLKQLAHLRLGPLFGAFLATLVIAGAIAGRWGTITNALAGRQVAPLGKYLHYFLVSRALGFILPKDLTDLGGRAAALNRFHSAPLTLAGASVLYDRLFDILSVALLLPPSLLYWGNWVGMETAIGLMGAIATSFLALSFTAHRPLVGGAIALFNWGTAQLQRLPLAGRRSLPTLVAPELTRPVLLRAFLFSLAKFGATVLRLILFSQALQTPIPSQVILLGAPVGQLSYLFAFTPGGLGIFEAGWFAILTAADVAESLITPFLVEQRVLTYLCVTLWALLGFLNYVVPRRGSPPA